MTNAPDASMIVGNAEIAAMAGGAQMNTVSVWKARYPDFPAPRWRVNGAAAYWRPDVEAWLRKTGRFKEASVGG